jgi:hypothetical protein
MSEVARNLAPQAVGIIGCLLLAGLIFQPPSTASETNQTFSFAVIGDIGYFPEEEEAVANLFAALNREKSLAFVVHVGDLALPRFACTNDLLERRLNQFHASKHPLIYTPGDNDWTDCHEPAVNGGDPFERLRKVRELFFDDEQSFGQKTLELVRQSHSEDSSLSKFSENARWDHGSVTFVSLHVVGSNNGLGQSPKGDLEFSERNSADLAWLNQAFRHAKAQNSRAIVIFQQANIFPDFSPAPTREAPSGSAELRELLTNEVRTFTRPVLLVHGDTHYFRIDNPLAPRAKRGELGIPSLENFTRVETYGTPYNHWVQIKVDGTEPSIFSYQSRIVRENIADKPK